MSPMTAARPWEYSAFPVRVVAKRSLSPSFVRITLAGPAVRNFADWGLDQRIKIVLPLPGEGPDSHSVADFGLLDEPTPPPSQWLPRWRSLPVAARNPLRAYTPSAVRPESEEVDLDIHLHEPAGPASTWAREVRPGDAVVVTGPDRRVGYTGYCIHYTPPVPLRHLLLVGDETAQPAMANILTALPRDARADVLLELGDPADDLVSSHVPESAQIRLVQRRGLPGRALLDAVTAWAVQNRPGTGPTGPGFYAWIACEAAAAVALRRRLTGPLGAAADSVVFRGYWKIGRPLAS